MASRWNQQEQGAKRRRSNQGTRGGTPKPAASNPNKNRKSTDTNRNNSRPAAAKPAPKAAPKAAPKQNKPSGVQKVQQRVTYFTNKNKPKQTTQQTSLNRLARQKGAAQVITGKQTPLPPKRATRMDQTLNPLEQMKTDAVLGRSNWISRATVPSKSLTAEERRKKTQQTAQRSGFNARARKQTLSSYDQKLPQGKRFQIQQAKQRWDEAAAKGDRAGMEKAHKEAESLRFTAGYSGGAAGNQRIAPKLGQDSYNRLNSAGRLAMTQAQMTRDRAVTEDEIARADRRIEEILNAPGYQNRGRDINTSRGMRETAEGRSTMLGATRKQREKDAEGLKLATHGAVLQGIGNTAVELRGLRDMAKYAGSDGVLEASPALWSRVSMLYDQLANETDPKKRKHIEDQIKWTEEHAKALDEETAKWSLDPHSPYFDATAAERLGMPTEFQPTMWDEMAQRGDELIAASNEGLNAAERFANDLYVNAIQMIPTTAAGLIPGVGGASVGAKLWNAARAATQTAALTQMSLGAGGARQRELLERGIPYEQAVTDSLMSAAIEFGTESLPLYYMSKLVGGTQRIGRTIPGAIAASAAIEGGEEGIAYTANALWSWMRGYEQDRFDWAEMGREMLAGGIIGGLHAGLGVAVNRAVTHLTSQGREQDANRVQAYMDDIDGIMEQSQQYEEMVRQGALSAEEGAAIQSQLQQDLVNKIQNIRDNVQTINDYQSMADQGVISQAEADQVRDTYGESITGQQTSSREELERVASQRLYQAALAANAINAETPAQAEARQAAERTDRARTIYRRGQSVMGAYQAGREAQLAREIREAQQTEPTETVSTANPVEEAQRMTDEALRQKDNALRQAAEARARAEAVQNAVPVNGRTDNLLNARELPLASDEKTRKAQEKLLRGESLTLSERLGDRDGKSIVKKLGDYELKPDHAYRVIPEAQWEEYQQAGKITRNIEEYIEGENNGGVDWYLGAAATKYGNKNDNVIILETPAAQDLFQLADDNGTRMVLDPTVRHIKSSSQANPVQVSDLTNVFALNKKTGEVTRLDIGGRNISAPANRMLTGISGTMGEKGSQALMTMAGELNNTTAVRDFVRVYNQALMGNTGIEAPRSMTQAEFNRATEAGIADRMAGITLDLKLSEKAAGRNKDAGINWSDSYVKGMDRQTAKTLDAYGKTIGAKIEFTEFTGANGSFVRRGNVITIAKDNPLFREDPVLFVMGHESTHRMQDLDVKSYNAFRDYVMSLPGSNEALEETLATYRNANAFKPGENQRYAAMDEVTADYAGRLLRDHEELRQFIRDMQQPKVLRALLKVFQEVRDFLTGRQKAQADEAVRLLEDAISGASKQLKQNERQGRQSDNNRSREGLAGEGEAIDPTSRMSLSSMGDAFGFTAVVDQDTGGVKYYRVNGRQVKRVTTRDVKQSKMYQLVDLARQNGTISAAEAEKQATYLRRLMNLVLKTNDSEMIYAFEGSMLWSAVKDNADKQYGMTIDFEAICKKTEQMVAAMSEAMTRKGRGLTLDEINELYGRVIEAGEPVPCPPCYVFTRWIGLGGLLDNIKSFQTEFADTEAGTEKARKRLDEIRGILSDEIADLRAEDDARVQKNLEAQARGEKKSKKDVTPKSDDDLTNQAKKARLAELDKAEGKLITKRNKALNKLQFDNLSEAERQKVQASIDAIDEEYNDLTNQMRTLRMYSWLKDVRLSDTYKEVPDSVLFNLRAGEEFASRFADTWAFRTGQGAYYGKAITPYTDMRTGEIIQGVHKSARDIKIGEANPFSGEFDARNLTKKQAEELESARLKVRQQNMRGGVRMQSVSDFRYEYGLDYIQAFFELQSIGAAVQTYSKVVEFVPMVASTGGFVNMSLIPWGTGFRNGKLAYSSVTGMDAEAAFKLQKQWDTAGTILIGVSDEHIRAAMADNDIYFIIPYHLSGGREDVIRQMLTSLGEKAEKYTDYSNVQSEKFPSQQNPVLALRNKILTASKTFDPTRAEQALLDSNEFLRGLYDRKFNRPEDPLYMLPMMSEDTKHIYPYEYWDVNSTYKTADVNGQRYLQWCEDLGVVPKFSGDKDGNKDFRNDKGYWKLLIDRRMYGRDGSYNPLTPINATGLNLNQLDRERARQTFGEAMTAPADLRKTKEIVDKAFPETAGKRFSLSPVEAVEPTNGTWKRGATFDEVKAEHPTLFALDADEAETRNPTQIKGTVSTYRKIYSKLQEEGFDGTILDASSGLGYGTQVGRDEFGYDVDDIEPFPDAKYKPRYTDYSTLDKTYDAIISNAVLNVIPQDLRDAMVVKIGEMLNPGGRAFINVRGTDVKNAGSKVPINEDQMEYFISNTGSYQKGFTNKELVAYLRDALGDEFTVEQGKGFGAVSAIVTKKPDIRYSLSGVDNVVAFPQNGRRSDAAMDETRIRELRASIQDAEDKLEFADVDGLSEVEVKRLQSRLIKDRNELDKLIVKERSLTRKTSIQDLLDNLDDYRRTDLESLAEQISEGAWDDYEELDDADLRDGIREMLEERAADMSPLEAQAARYGFNVRPPERYSLGTEGYDRARLMRENQQLKEKLDYWRGQVKKSDRTKADPKEVRKLANSLRTDYSTEMDAGEITQRLQAIYDGIGKDWSYDRAYEEAGKLARDMIEQATETEDYLYNENEPLRKFFKDTPLVVTPEIRRAIPDYNEWRKAQFGKLRLQSGDQTNIDQVFQEAAAQWPEWFSEEVSANSLDQLERIADVLDGIYRRDEVNPFGDDIAGPAGYLTTQIMDSFWDVPSIKKTFADRAEERLGREVTRRLDMKERYENALQKVREQRDRKLREQSEKYLTAKRKRSQQQKERELRVKIQRHVKKLSTKLRTPTDTQHIPEDLIPTVRTALESINLASKDMKDTKRTQAFEALRKMYQEMDTNGSEVVIDPDLLPNISDIIGFADTPIANLGLEDLNTIWQTVRAIEASISTFNKALGRAKFETISQPAFGIRDYLRGRKDRGDYRGPIRAFDKLMNFGMLTPEQFFSRLGQDGKDIFKMLRSAQDHHITIMQNAQEWTNKLIKGSRVKQLEKEMKTFDFDGQSVTLSTAQIMSLYELMKRQQAIDHIMVGGVRPESVKRGIKERTPSEPWRLTQDQIGEIVGSLTEEEVKLADEMQGYMEKVLAELGNEASMEVYGYRKFTEKHYFPISVDKNQTQSDVKNDAVSGTIAGWGSARPVKPNANNAVILRSIFDVYADHTTEMANYAAWLAPMENLNRIFNFRYKNEAGDLEGGVKTMLERAFGKNGPNYWKQLQEDLNNGVHGRNDNPFQTLIGAYKGSAIGANIRVIAQQPTAILRALDEINPADFVAGVALSKPGKFNNVVMKYAPIAVWKNWGYFTADTGRQMRNVLFNDDSGVQKLNNFLMQGAGTADSVAWTHIWNAVEVETRRKRKDLEPGSEAFYEVVAERFGDIIDRTQVVDGILQRSQIMRSPDNLTKMATSFMAEPTKVYNMMTGALYDVRNATGAERSKAMRKLARTSVALLASFVANAAAQSLVDALRDDDKDEEYWQKFLQAFWGGEGESRGEKIKDAILNGNVEAAFNPATYIPWAKDIVSLTQGFNVSRMDMDTISRVVKEIGNTMRAMNGEGKLTKQNAILRLSVEMARFLGIPASNLKRDIMSGMWTFYNETHNYRQLYEMERFLYDPTASNNQKEFVKILFAAQQAGDQDAYQHIRQDLIDSGIPEDKLDKKLSTMMKDEMSEGGKMEEQYNRVYDAYEEIMKASPGYQGLDAEQQEKVQTSLANYAKAKAIAEASGEEFATEDNEMNAIQKAEAAGVDPVTWKSFRVYTASLKGTGKIKEPAEAWLNKNGITGAQYDYCMEHYS